MNVIWHMTYDQHNFAMLALPAIEILMNSFLELAWY